MLWPIHLDLIGLWPLRGGSTDRLRALELENRALRQQLAVLRRAVRRPKATWMRFWQGTGGASQGRKTLS